MRIISTFFCLLLCSTVYAWTGQSFEAEDVNLQTYLPGFKYTEPYGAESVAKKTLEINESTSYSDLCAIAPAIIDRATRTTISRLGTTNQEFFLSLEESRGILRSVVESSDKSLQSYHRRKPNGPAKKIKEVTHVPYAEISAPTVHITHAGGVGHILRFLEGKGVGYALEQYPQSDAKTYGIQVIASSEKFVSTASTDDYAHRAVPRFDFPAILTAEIAPHHLRAAENADEAGLQASRVPFLRNVKIQLLGMPGKVRAMTIKQRLDYERIVHMPAALKKDYYNRAANHLGFIDLMI